MSRSAERPSAGIRTRLVLAASAACLALAAWIAGFLFFNLRASGFWLLPDFGLLGAIVFLQSFPWFLLTIVLLLTGIACFLARRTPPVRGRLGRSAALALACVLAAGCALAASPLYAGWRPPPADSLPLRGYGAWRFHHLFHGTVTSVGEEGYVIENPDGRRFGVQVTPGTRFPEGKDFAEGDALLVIGELRDGTIRAFGIRPFDDQNSEPVMSRSSAPTP